MTATPAIFKKSSDIAEYLTTVLQDSEAVENALIDLGIFVG